MPYNEQDYKVSNINYLNKDFTDFKGSLIEYAKAYDMKMKCQDLRSTMI